MSRTLANATAKDRPSTDFYRTPREVTIALLDYLKLRKNEVIWEPACGEGHMTEVMKERGYKVTATDLYSTGHDFLKTKRNADWIITNPPFIASERFIRHAASLPIAGFAFLLKSQYWHSTKRLSLFREIPPAAVLPLTWRPDFLFGTKGGNPTMEVLWTVWEYPFDIKVDTIYCPLPRPQ